MKISSLLAITFVFLAFLTEPFLLGASPEPLLDLDGDKIIPGNNYFIVSAIWGAGGGGISLIPGKHDRCLRDVIQLPSDLEKGRSVYFQLVNDTVTDYIYDSTDLYIIFSPYPTITLCTSPVPQAWKVDDFDPSTGQWFITTSGGIGDLGPLTSRNWFKFEKFSTLDGVYKINHCPDSTSTGLCKDVGIYYAEGARRLALSDNPLLVVIIKATSVLNKARIASVV